MKNKFSDNYRNTGFTMVESMVAIVILLLVITGASGAVQRGLSSYVLSKEQVIAFYLAQEAIEEIRNNRDENGVKGDPWLTEVADNFNDPCWFGQSCMVDVTANSIDRCSGGCPVLTQNPTTGFYGYGYSNATPFTRTITLTQVGANEVIVTATITWVKGSMIKTFTARENIFNWQ